MDEISLLQEAAVKGKILDIIKDEKNTHLAYLHGQIHHRLIKAIMSKHKGDEDSIESFIELQLKDHQTIHVTQRQILRQLKHEYEAAIKSGVEVVQVPDDLFKHKHKPHFLLESIWTKTLEWILITHRMGIDKMDLQSFNDATEALESVVAKQDFVSTVFDLPEHERERKLCDILALTRGIRIFKSYLRQQPVHPSLEQDLRSVYNACKSGIAENRVVFPLFRCLSQTYLRVEYELMVLMLDGMIGNLHSMELVLSDALTGNGHVIMGSGSRKSSTKSLYMLSASIPDISYLNGKQMASVQTDTHPPHSFSSNKNHHAQTGEQENSQSQIVVTGSSVRPANAAATAESVKTKKSSSSTETSTEPAVSATGTSPSGKIEPNFHLTISDQVPVAKQYSEWEYRADAIKKAKMQVMRNVITQSTETSFKREVGSQCWVHGKEAGTQTRKDTAIGPPRTIRAVNGQLLVFEV